MQAQNLKRSSFPKMIVTSSPSKYFYTIALTYMCLDRILVTQHLLLTLVTYKNQSVATEKGVFLFKNSARKHWNCIRIRAVKK